MARFSLRAAVVALVLGAAGLLRADEAAPLPPDTRAFLEETRQNLRSDRLLLDQYTFSETFTEKRLDGKGAVKKAKTEVYEVYPSLEPGKMYRRLIARDGEAALGKGAGRAGPQAGGEDGEARAPPRAGGCRRAPEAPREGRGEPAKGARDRRRDLPHGRRSRSRDARTSTAAPRSSSDSLRNRAFVPRPTRARSSRRWRAARGSTSRTGSSSGSRRRCSTPSAWAPPAWRACRRGRRAISSAARSTARSGCPPRPASREPAKVLLLFGTRVDVLSQYGQYKKFSVGTEEEVSTEKATN